MAELLAPFIANPVGSEQELSAVYNYASNSIANSYNDPNYLPDPSLPTADSAMARLDAEYSEYAASVRASPTWDSGAPPPRDITDYLSQGQDAEDVNRLAQLERDTPVSTAIAGAGAGAQLANAVAAVGGLATLGTVAALVNERNKDLQASRPDQLVMTDFSNNNTSNSTVLPNDAPFLPKKILPSDATKNLLPSASSYLAGGYPLPSKKKRFIY